MIETDLVSWDEIVREFEGNRFDRDWLFRGDFDATWTPKTSLERHAPDGILRARAEERLLREFKARAHFYLPAQLIPNRDETAEWLALMQHFGAPTRLLDITRSPYVALYFAIESLPPRNDDGTLRANHYAAVWGFQRTWCLTAAGAAIFKDLPDQKATMVRKIGPGRRYPAGTDPAFAQGKDSSRLRGDAWRSKLQHTVVVPYVPETLSQRLSIQQGEFLVPRNVDKPFIDNLNALGDSGDFIRKYRVPYSERAVILERLRRMNVTREQLFPGMDGFAQSFQQFLYEESDEQRRARERSVTLQLQQSETVRTSTGVLSAAVTASLEQQRNNALLSGPTDPRPDAKRTEQPDGKTPAR
ncbi:MAG TPA: FRG domain-containing protein [Vicinamibacterales bacterium]|jgi:hypothetical protein